MNKETRLTGRVPVVLASQLTGSEREGGPTLAARHGTFKFPCTVLRPVFPKGYVRANIIPAAARCQ